MSLMVMSFKNLPSHFLWTMTSKEIVTVRSWIQRPHRSQRPRLHHFCPDPLLLLLALQLPITNPNRDRNEAQVDLQEAQNTVSSNNGCNNIISSNKITNNNNSSSSII